MSPASRASWTRAVAALVAASIAPLTAACGAGGGFTTASSAPDAPRRPDGVVLDAPPALPSASIAASATGVIALREPRDDTAIREVLLAYVRGFARQDLELLTSLLTKEAVDLGPRTRTGRAGIVEAWQARLRTLDYSRVAVNDVLRLDRIDRLDFDQMVSTARPSEMQKGDMLVRVPIAKGLGEPRLFGTTLVVLLRREQGQLAIAGVTEEDGPTSR